MCAYDNHVEDEGQRLKLLPHLERACISQNNQSVSKCLFQHTLNSTQTNTRSFRGNTCQQYSRKERLRKSVAPRYLSPAHTQLTVDDESTTPPQTYVNTSGHSILRYMATRIKLKIVSFVYWPKRQYTLYLWGNIIRLQTGVKKQVQYKFQMRVKAHPRNTWPHKHRGHLRESCSLR